MTGLRRTTKSSAPAGDIEAPDDKNQKVALLDGPPSSPAATKPKGSHSPIFLAKAIINKVVSLADSSEDEINIFTAGGIIALVKDVFLGIILGVFTISMLILLDHRNVIHFQSAHNFRSAAFSLLNDPETIANIEESSDLRFMVIADFESKQGEIDRVAKKLEAQGEILAKQDKDMNERKKEIELIRSEYETLMANPILGLDKFCGECAWNGRTTCDARVTFLQDTYGNGPIVAKVATMFNTKGCVKQD